MTVWAPSVQKVVTNKVTDPYSIALTADSTHSLVVDLDARNLAPSGWSAPEEAAGRAAAPTRRSRSCTSATSPSRTAPCPTALAAPTCAFTDRLSEGSEHLRDLAKAGSHYVHLLPAFDFGTIPEKPSEQAAPDCDLTSFAARLASSSRSASARARPRTPTTGATTRCHYTVARGLLRQ